MADNRNNRITFSDLQWDTNFFGVKCAKVILHQSLTLADWMNLKDRFCDYTFVTIENSYSDPTNAQLIGKYSSAFLADVNIQFVKKLESPGGIPKGIYIEEKMEPNEQILHITEFEHSKFLADPELTKRGGAQVYTQWLKNAFGKAGKYFAVSKDTTDHINGYILYSFSGSACTIELIHVSKQCANMGIGTKLILAAEASAFDMGYQELRVGTQIRNEAAINFYHKTGFKQAACHQIYHLWNL